MVGRGDAAISPPANSMLEKDLQQAVIELAHTFGWVVAHFRTAMGKRGNYMTPVGADGKGFPDLCLCRERIVFLELKVRYRSLTPEQTMWRDRIRAAGGEWWLVTEKTWHEGKLDEILIPYQHPIPPPSLGA